MACVNADGSLSPSGLLLLRSLSEPGSERELAARTGRPLFQVRAGMRELVGAGLVAPGGNGYGLTDRGRKRVEEDRGSGRPGVAH